MMYHNKLSAVILTAYFSGAIVETRVCGQIIKNY